MKIIIFGTFAFNSKEAQKYKKSIEDKNLYLILSRIFKHNVTVI